MISQAPASVARSRAPERASTSPPGPRPPSAARVDNATVIGRRAADPPDRTEPPARTGASVTGSAFYTRGSHEDDVVRVQGTPARIDRYPSLGYETWEFSCQKAGVRVKYKQPYHPIWHLWGVPLGEAALSGIVIGTLVWLVVISSISTLWLAALLCLVVGLLSNVPGAAIVKLYRWLRDRVIG